MPRIQLRFIAESCSLVGWGSHRAVARADVGARLGRTDAVATTSRPPIFATVAAGLEFARTRAVPKRQQRSCRNHFVLRFGTRRLPRRLSPRSLSLSC